MCNLFNFCNQWIIWLWPPNLLDPSNRDMFHKYPPMSILPPNYKCQVDFRPLLNGLQVNVFDREFTKCLIIRDFDDVLKNPFRYVHLFLLHTLLSKNISENYLAWPVIEGPKSRCYIPPPIKRGSDPYKFRFLTNQFYWTETLETWSVSRKR